MLELPVDETPLQPMQLSEDPLRGGPIGLGEESLSASFSLSTPYAIPLDEKLVAGDSELAAFWAKQKGQYDFDYVTFRCDFAPTPSEPIEKAWIEVKLEPGPDAAATPIIWSMAPDKEVDQYKSTSSAKLAGEYVLKAELGTSVETPLKKWFLRARGTQAASGYWEFRDNGISQIEGTFRLNLVVRRAAAAAAAGQIDVGIVVAKRTFLLFRRHEEKGGDATRFLLPQSPGSA